MILARAGPGVRFNEHMGRDGEIVFRRTALTVLNFGHPMARALAISIPRNETAIVEALPGAMPYGCS